MNLPRCIPLLMVLAFLVVFGCKKTDTRAIAFAKVKEVAKISFVEFDLSKVVYAERKKWLTSDATFIAKSEATVSLGFDLSKFDADCIKIDGTIITVTFPPVEMINFSYPAEKLQLVNKYTQNVFWNRISVENQEEALRFAEKDIRDRLSEIDLTKKVKENARAFLEPILNDLGYSEVYIKIDSL